VGPSSQCNNVYSQSGLFIFPVRQTVSRFNLDRDLIVRHKKPTSIVRDTSTVLEPIMCMAPSNDQLSTVSLDTDYDIDEVSTAKIKHGGPLPIVHTHLLEMVPPLPRQLFGASATGGARVRPKHLVGMILYIYIKVLHRNSSSTRF
jgi:hypothetical protein